MGITKRFLPYAFAVFATLLSSSAWAAGTIQLGATTEEYKCEIIEGPWRVWTFTGTCINITENGQPDNGNGEDCEITQRYTSPMCPAGQPAPGGRDVSEWICTGEYVTVSRTTRCR